MSFNTQLGMLIASLKKGLVGSKSIEKFARIFNFGISGGFVAQINSTDYPHRIWNREKYTALSKEIEFQNIKLNLGNYVSIVIISEKPYEEWYNFQKNKKIFNSDNK